jgi:hypothetical protein
MSNRPSLAIVAVLAGLWLGAAPAQAGERGASVTCGVFAPRYQPKPHSAPSEAVRFKGGARLYRPVAAPCPPPRRPVDV